MGDEITAEVETFDLRQLKAELLRQEASLAAAEARKAVAEADLAEIALSVKLDEERDRKVMGGHIRHLNLNLPISGAIIDKWIDALEHWERRDPGEPITITIDSPGGDVIGGFALFDTIQRIRRNGHHVTTRGRGMVASMAGALLQAGDARTMDENAQLLIHEISFGTSGSMSTVEDFAVFAKKLQNRLLNLLAERSTMSKAQIQRKWKKTDWWLNADEALSFGFIDRIE